MTFYATEKTNTSLPLHPSIKCHRGTDYGQGAVIYVMHIIAPWQTLLSTSYNTFVNNLAHSVEFAQSFIKSWDISLVKDTDRMTEEEGK
ncbi:hypothetical protein CWI38_0116p0020 [Hamiltosporidium tvaerminnensis]|uniref:Uncharacterized protein n=2 Tax=Hamiltosporidium TaxID=1176354 RepID=A0A4Q9LM28_9MICR|nr:hypothetical protein CWI39_0076p0010 [Hamiltosporidium magnivora]TBU20191.1 hypothetical protein CWI38_0116p0020 [Hamiltosporidium tvaerminnensis]